MRVPSVAANDEPLRYGTRPPAEPELTWQPESSAEQLDQQHLDTKQVKPDGGQKTGPSGRQHESCVL